MTATRTFTCPGCAASLAFDPRRTALSCRYCGAAIPLWAERDAVPELDFEEQRRLEREALARPVPDEGAAAMMHCGACGADTTPAPGVAASACPFCAGLS